MDPYKILGVDKTASSDEIKAAYRKMATKYHPDAGGDSWAFQQVQEAFDELTGKQKRRSKDQSTSGSKPSSPTGPSPGGESKKKERSEADNESADPFAGFHSAAKKTQNTSRQKKASDSRKSLFIVVGIIGSGTCALIVAWLIIRSTPIQNLTTSLPNQSTSVDESKETKKAKPDVRQSEPNGKPSNQKPVVGQPSSDDQMAGRTYQKQDGVINNGLNGSDAQRQSNTLQASPANPHDVDGTRLLVDRQPSIEEPEPKVFPKSNGSGQTDIVEENLRQPPPAIAPFHAETAKRHQQASADYLGLPIEYENSIGIKLRLIPAGKFLMGSPASEAGRKSDEMQHEVTLTKPFYLGVYEVTQEQYVRVMGNNPSKFKGAQNPVENVSWNDAVEFCRKLTAQPNEKAAGRINRLPTEAEWEYAVRAGTPTAYSFDDDTSRLVEFAWFKGNAVRKTHPVGQKKPNPWGLYDSHGNVWEWCRDRYGAYPAGLARDPTGPSTGSPRVNRGGAWGNDAGYCRSSYRNGNSPSHRGSGLGFRVVLDVDVNLMPKETEKEVAPELVKVSTPLIIKNGNATNKVRQIEVANPNCVLSTTQLKQRLLIWLPNDLRKVSEINAGHSVDCISLDGEGQNVVIGSNFDKRKTHPVAVWNINSRKRRALHNHHKGGVRTVAFSPDGSLIASAGDESSVIVWDYKSDRLVARLNYPTSVKYVTFSPSGKSVLVCGEDRLIRELGLPSGDTLRKFEGHEDKVLKTCFSRDGKKLISVGRDHTLRFWDSDTAILELSILAHRKAIWDVSVSSDGNLILTASQDGTASIWNWRGSELARFQAKSAVWTAQFDADDRHVFLGCEDGTISRWRIPELD